MARNKTWYERIEAKLLPSLRKAAIAAFPAVRRVELDLLNSDIRVIAAERPSASQYQDVRAAVEEAGAALHPSVQEWPVNLRRPFPRPFTVHLKTPPQELRPFLHPETVVVFEIVQSQLLAMRDAESLLAREAALADIVVTFALGGTSTLRRLSEREWEAARPRDPREAPAALDRFAERFHLFPGFSWSGRNVERPAFVSWISQLPDGCCVLVFDTGSVGTGPRTVANILREDVPSLERFGPASVRIIGLVDREVEDQRPERVSLKTARGKGTEFTIDYFHVPRLLSEDCQVLMGYDSNRQIGAMLPIRDNAIIRVVDDDGHVLQITASSSASGVFNALMTNAPSPPPSGGVPLSRERELAMVDAVLQYAHRGEYCDLNNAWAWGLLGDAEFEAEAAGMARRYEAARERYPHVQWDFTSKRLVRPVRPGEGQERGSDGRSEAP